MCEAQYQHEVADELAQEEIDSKCADILSDALWRMMVALNRARAEEITGAAE